LTAEVRQNGSCVVACPKTPVQLANMESNTLRAPRDDYADAFARVLVGCRYGMVSNMV